MGPYGRKISSEIFSESTQQIHSQKFMHTPREVFYQSRSKNCEISNFGFLYFFPFSLTWDHMGVNTSNDNSSESAHHIHSPNFSYVHREGL